MKQAFGAALMKTMIPTALQNSFSMNIPDSLKVSNSSRLSLTIGTMENTHKKYSFVCQSDCGRGRSMGDDKQHGKDNIHLN